MNIKLKFRSLLTFLFVSVSMLMPTAAWADFDANGFGTGNDAGKYQEPPFNNGYYQIGNAGQLYWFAEKVNKNSGSASYNAQLTNDIVVNEKVLEKVADGKKSELRTWTPIGTLSNGYTGAFLGNNYTISGLYYEGSYYNVGLFGTSYYYSYGNPPVQNAVINNVNIKDTYFRTTKYNVGGIIGSMSFGSIQSCSFEGILEGSYNVGGICGYLQNRSSQSYIRQSYSTGSVSGSSSVGGICGSISNNTFVSACYNHGSVKCSGSYAGGIVGSNSGTIEDCYNIGNVIASSPNQIAYKEYGSSISKCFYLSDSETIDGGRTLKQFNIGRVCSEMNQYYWRQNADADFPSFEGELSSYVPCVDHHYDDGVCTVCDVWEIPSQDNEGYYLLKNANNLYWFAQYVNAGSTGAKAKLTADITVNKNVLDRVSTGNTSELRTWNPIGNSYNSRYVGEFDGQGYSISGLYYNNANTEYVGLFGDVYSTNTSAIRNIIVKDSYFKGSQYVGGICGYIGTASSIDNCIFEGNIYGGYGTGGICGYQYYSGTINNCGFIGTVNDGQSGGGICGTVYGSVNNSFCYINNSKIDFSSNSYGSINNCYCLADKENSKGGRTAKQFALGQVCYLLNNGNANPVWRQVLNKDKYPTFVGDEVTAEVLKCDHVYGNNGCCIKCDALKVPSFDENGVVLIADASDLLWFANYVSTEEFTSANARLVNDIVVNENVVAKVHAGQTEDLVKWIPIGTGNNAYMGTFDSNNKTVSGLYVEGESNVGFFGNARTIIKDLRVEDSYFKGTSYNVGGICGNYSGNEVSNCSFSGEVYGNVYVGGIIGYASNNNANISKCYNEGNITATSSFVGGICGYKPKLVTDCYNTGKITNTYYSGSAAGICSGGLDTDIITNCYNTGLLSAYSVYDISEKSYRNCYFLSTAETSKGGKTAAQFANGEVCALLNGGRTIWRQSIGNDAAPSFEGAIVEKSTCQHDYDANDLCTICGRKKKLIEPVNGFYLISNFAELEFFANEFENSCAVVNARLTNDITINEEDATTINLWKPIGNANKPFDGIFDGDGHSIIGLKFTDKSQKYVGLFGQTSNATIKNLKLIKADIVGNDFVGGICATAGIAEKNIPCILYNCEFEGIISGNQYVGGICGAAYNGDIQQCGNKGDINGTQYVGGISGYLGTVKNCYNWGAITSSGSYYGSIIGYRGIIDYCYNVGTPSYLGSSYSTSTKKNYYISDNDSQNGKTIEQFKNGEVCLLLNTGNSNPVWCQNVDVDQYPSFVGKNILTKEDLVCHHIFDNGICSKCNGYEPATENNGWYEIANAGQLYWYVINNKKSNGRLIDNIVVNASLDIDNIGNSGSLKEWDSYPLENAEFDGQGFSISGLYAKNGDNLGLFSYIKNAEVKNVKILNSFFNGDSRIGGICGSAENSIITNCSFDGKLSGKSTIGGICGRQSTESVISQCYNLGELYASSDYVGGITGYVPTSSGNKLIDCYNAGLIKTGNNNVHYGVICGATSCNDLKIINCINVNSNIPHRWSSIMCSDFTFNTNSWDVTNHESMFESGELCWKLNGNSSEGVWRQTLGTDKYPTFEGLKVSKVDENTYINKKEPVLVDGFYVLADAEDLYWFAKKVNEGETDINARVIANITLNENVLIKVEAGETEGLREWTPIGNGQYQYKGTFDGGGFVISGLYYDSFDSFAGLFGYCFDEKIITNVHIRDSYINGNNNPAAGICGYINSNGKQGYISKCSFDGIVKGALTAGICNITSSPIEDCYNLGTIVNGYGIGNAMNPSLISNSYSIGSRVVVGHANNCFYLSDEETVDGGRTAEQFANGRVCWDLNNRSAEGVWRQNKEDNHPSFVGAIVDFTSCSHDYSKANGVCNLCGTKCKHEEHTTAGICLICGKTCEHQFVEGICICGSVCEHPEFKNGACAICGKICSHDHYENGACNVCGIYQTPEQDVEGYYLLANVNNLYWFADYVNNNTDANINARVVNDITVNENLIKKINNSEFDGLKFWNPIIEFKGKFDGGGYIVSGLIGGLDSKCGFFKSAFYAEIHGLNIRDSYFAGFNSAAGICVLARGNTKISNCSFDGILPDIKDKAGICCDNSGTIEDCYNLASNDKGIGICSENYGIISNCYNYNVDALSPIANQGNVENCYYLSDIETEDGGRTAAQFADGTVTALLNNGRIGDDIVWFQNGDKPGFKVADEEQKNDELFIDDVATDVIVSVASKSVHYKRTNIENNWGTLCLPFAFSASNCNNNKGVTLFDLTFVNDEVVLTQVNDVRAGQPVLFYMANPGDLDVMVSGNNISLTSTPEENTLIGTFTKQQIPSTETNAYYIKGNKFWKGNGFKVQPFHAFFIGNDAELAPSSFRLALPEETEQTEEQAATGKQIQAIYNVQGQRVGRMNDKGVYVIIFDDGTSQKVRIAK